MTSFQPSRLTPLYIAAIAVSGGLAFGYSVFTLTVDNALTFAAFLAAAILASALKVNLPTITGTMSVNSLFLLVSIVQLKQGETMIIGLAGVLMQCYWKPKSRALLVRVMFSAAANTLAIAASYYVFEHPLLGGNLEGISVLLTATAYFVVNTALVAMVVSLTEKKPVQRVWTDCYSWCFPYYMGGAGIAWISTTSTFRFGWQAWLVLVPVIYFVYRSYKLYLQRVDDERKHVEDMAGLHLRTIEALALAIEAKDHTTHEHLRRVRVYALELGARMGLNALELQALRAAALLHDIGKLAVPEHIISKPGKLTLEEFERMKIHPVVGAQILDQVQFPYPVAPIVLAHHEKWDGSGYPSGLRGSEIPVGARILSAVDSLDALASDRQYRRALPLDQAMSIVAEQAGKAFDPEIIRLLQSCYVELEEKAVLQPHSGVRLDTELVISRGSAPATGLEQDAGLALPVADATAVAEDPLLSAANARQVAQELHEWSASVDTAGQNLIRLADMLAVYAVRIRELVPCDAIVFYMKHDRQLIPEFVGGQNRKLFASLTIPWGEGLSGWVADNGKPILNGNPSVEAGYLNDPAKFSILGSCLAVPLESAAGVAGVLALYRIERDAFSAKDLRTLTAMSSRVAMAIQSAAARRATLASFPSGLGLPGIRHFFVQVQQEVEQRRDTHRTFGLALCDLDNFGEIIRRHGHHVGDRVIDDLSFGLRAIAGHGTTVAHLGGDEFALLFPEVTVEELDHHLDAIRFAVNMVGRGKVDPLSLSCSTGSALFPADGADPEALLSVAEHRLQRAKAAGRAKQKLPSPATLLSAAS